MFYLPIIREHDFEAFRKIMGSHLAYTYDGWLKLGAEWRADPELQPFIEVEIDPDPFKRFIVGEGNNPDINALSKFATLLGKNKAGTP